MPNKVIGWGKCAIKQGASGSQTTYDDIVENSCQLSVEEGEETTANIEGGSAEASRRKPDKYILTYNRRIDTPSEVTVGYTENGEDVEVVPESVGAVGAKLTGSSKHVSVKFDTTDGLVAVYTHKTKGTTDANGALTDITLPKKASS